jgi:hypothetical protein
MKQKVLDGREVYSTAEVAALFRVSSRTVNRWALEGRFANVAAPTPFVKLHRAYAFDKAEIDKLLTDFTRETPATK